ncbi:hypothetical protein [Pelagicoccus mobilis]|nr:hypothetical protein [Pelagicoccus mobilis]
MSGLCYVSQHLSKACRKEGKNGYVIDLLESNPCPDEFRTIEPLRLSLGALKDKLKDILVSEGYSEFEEIKEAFIRFGFTDPKSDWATFCVVGLKDTEGVFVQKSVDQTGKTTKLIEHTTEQVGGHNSGGCAPSA